MKSIIGTFREPLVHFLLIGLVIFLAFGALNEPIEDATTDAQIEVTANDVSAMVAQFEKAWRRVPTREELDALIEARVRESILVREALALSMDQGDAVINQRLSQKMTFLMESAARANPPSGEDLSAYFKENEDKYRSRPLIAFEHVYFGDTLDQGEVDAALSALANGADPTAFGKRTMMPPRIPSSPPNAIDGAFGRGFFERLAGSEPGKWEGPVQSGFGFHAVRVSENVPGGAPDFEAVQDRVIADYTSFAAAELSEAMFADLRARYVVMLPDASEIEGALQ